MGVHIHIPADAVWGFFQESRKRLMDIAVENLRNFQEGNVTNRVNN